jgi:hypothetical protein
MKDWNQHKINEFCVQRKIEWIFNAFSASHMNCVTESENDQICTTNTERYFERADCNWWSYFDSDGGSDEHFKFEAANTK